MITFTEIVACNGTVLYQTIGNQLTFVTSGRLSVLLAFDGMVLMKMNEFQYGVNPELEIVYDNKDPQFSLVLILKKYTQGQWILKINENSDSVYSCLNQKCYLKNKRAEFTNQKREKHQQYQKPVQNAKQQMLESVPQSNNSNMSAKSVLVGASRQIGKGLAFTGGLLSKGFDKLGGLISKKVQPSQKNVEIKQSTKENIKLASKTSKRVFQFTSEQVKNLFHFGKQVASDVGERFQKSEKGKQLQQNKYYEPVKEGAKTGVTVFANIYEGVVNAVYQIGSGISNGATKIIGAKYGKDAAQASDGVFEGVGNAAKIMRVPQDQAANALK